jgi:hypothetical protein
MLYPMNMSLIVVVVVVILLLLNYLKNIITIEEKS